MSNIAVSATIATAATASAMLYQRSANIVAALVPYLTDQAGILNLYPLRLPQNPIYPCCSFQVISNPCSYSLDGAIAYNPLIQIDCWAKSYLAAHAMADTIERALSGYVGRMGGVLNVSECVRRERQDLYEPDIDDYRVMMEFSIWHN